MRERLKILAGKRIQVFATVGRFGSCKGFKGRMQKTVVFVDLRDKHGNELTGHLWFRMHLQLLRLNLKPGDKVRFSARVMPYVKGYKGPRVDVDSSLALDYGLKYPTKFFKITEQPVEQIGLFAQK